jgi:hypothetical protein
VSGSNQQPYAGLTTQGIVVVKTASMMTLCQGPPFAPTDGSTPLGGQAGSASLPPDVVWDWVNHELWICIAGDGTPENTEWIKVQFSTGADFTDITVAGSISAGGNIQAPAGLISGQTLSSTGNIEADGNVNATDGNFSGNLSVGGTLNSSAISTGAVTGTSLGLSGDLNVGGKSNLTGRTDGTVPAAGLVGQRLSVGVAAGTGPFLTSGVVANITSMALPAGDWMITANGFFEILTAAQSVVWWLNTTSATLTGSVAVTSYMNTDSPQNGTMGGPVGVYYVNNAAPATIYLSAQVFFAAGTVRVYGTIYARRLD